MRHSPERTRLTSGACDMSRVSRVRGGVWRVSRGLTRSVSFVVKFHHQVQSIIVRRQEDTQQEKRSPPARNTCFIYSESDTCPTAPSAPSSLLGSALPLQNCFSMLNISECILLMCGCRVTVCSGSHPSLLGAGAAQSV